MEDERVISFERGKQLADSLGLEFYETSAKENINVRVSISPKPNQEGNGPIVLWFQIELIAISFTWLQRDLILYALPSSLCIIEWPVALTLSAGNKARSALQAVFERLVDIICDKMSESLDNDPGLLNPKGGTRLGEGAQPSNVNCNC